MTNFSFVFRALRYRNYRLFFSGQIVSLIGTWMGITASSWLVYRLTGSAWLLGVVGFASQFPALVFSPMAGVYVDRWDRHRLLKITQALSMLQSFILAGLTLTGHITIPWIIGLNVVNGIINAFDIPCRQSLVVSLIEDKEDLSNAIALNSSMFNLARLIGPSIAGVIIALSSEGWCFLIDGLSYLSVLTSLFLIKPPAQKQRESSQQPISTQIREGWRYAYNSVPIRSLLILSALVGLMGTPYGVLVPVFAGTILHGGPHTLGFLMTASGCGALMAALWLASRKSVVGLGRAIALATTTFGLGLVLFSFSRVLWLSLIGLFIAGAGFMVQMAASNTILQTIVDDDKRGRVMSLFLMALLGTTPFGSLIVGRIATHIGAPLTATLCGTLCLGGAFWFTRQLPHIRRSIRPIYEKMGLMPGSIPPA